MSLLDDVESRPGEPRSARFTSVRYSCNSTNPSSCRTPYNAGRWHDHCDSPRSVRVGHPRLALPLPIPRTHWFQSSSQERNPREHGGPEATLERGPHLRSRPTSSRCPPSLGCQSSTSRSEEHTSELQSSMYLVCRL